MEEIKIITGPAQAEITEKKSRFIASVFEIHSEEEAAQILDAARKKYYDARHNCYAYSLYKGSIITRSGDDGEPSGTAGKPILEAITRAGYQNTLIIVTRYFGGILLGTGGLSRAYSQAARDVLEKAQELGLSAPLYEGICMQLTCDYSMSGKLQYIISQMQVRIQNTEYGQNVTMSLIVPCDRTNSFTEKITEATNAASEIIIGDKVSYIMKNSTPIIYSL